MPQYYRGEVSQSASFLARLDLTTDRAIVVVARFFLLVTGLTFRSLRREARDEFHGTKPGYGSDEAG